MYTSKKKSKTAQTTVVQKKANNGFQIQDNRAKNTTKTVAQLASSDVIQKKDMHYWVVKRGGNKRYIGSFKSHAAANRWWAANKSSYVGYTFGQGSSATKYR
jgi:hypothetical protein